jgi:hypothetical protein
VNIGGLEFRAPIPEEYRQILSPDARRFVERLAAQFEGWRQELLAARVVRQEDIRKENSRIFSRKRGTYATPIGQSRPSVRISPTEGWRSPDRPSARC